VRGVLRGLVSTTSRTTVVDLEAGLEHLSRGTARHVDTLLLIAEPYFKSLEAAQRSFALAKDLGIGRIYMVANKVRSPRDEETVREFAGRHTVGIAGVIPYDPAVVEADELGTAVMDQRPDATSVAAIRRLADQLLTTAA
jgi:CO dehydrogenase maturation factor